MNKIKTIFLVFCISLNYMLYSQTHIVYYNDTNYMVNETSLDIYICRGDTNISVEYTGYLTLKDSLGDGFWIVLRKDTSQDYYYMTSWYKNGKKNGLTLIYDIDSKGFHYLRELKSYKDGKLNGTVEIWWEYNYTDEDSYYLSYALSDTAGEMRMIHFSYNYKDNIKQGWSKIRLGNDFYEVFFDYGQALRWRLRNENGEIIEKGKYFPKDLHPFFILPCDQL